MTNIRILGQNAWKAAATKPASRWHEEIARFQEDLVTVHHIPKFALSHEDRFFCIGSCFARNIEEHLIYQGVDVLSKRIICPKTEWAARPNGLVNKFTTHSIVNEIEWANKLPLIDESFFVETTDGWIDPQLTPGSSSVSLNRAIERRRYLSCEYFARIKQATVLVLTLGLNEVWFDKAINRHLNSAPSYYATKRHPERYELHMTDVSENMKELEKIHFLLNELNPHAKIVLTVSPVPMSETFSGLDILVANMNSKSTLRSAAAQFAANHPNVDYFPSYDMIAMSPRTSVYTHDCLHVVDRVVGRIMQEFLRKYIGSDAPLLEFTELGYLAANPDVDEAVRSGVYGSGYEHWIETGKSENREIYPKDGPTELMRAAGVRQPNPNT